MADSVPFMRLCLSRVNLVRQFNSCQLSLPFPVARSGTSQHSVATVAHPPFIRSPFGLSRLQTPIPLAVRCDVPRGGTLLCFGVFQPKYAIGHTPPGSGSGRVRPVRIQGIMPFRRILRRQERGLFQHISKGQ